MCLISEHLLKFKYPVWKIVSYFRIFNDAVNHGIKSCNKVVEDQIFINFCYWWLFKLYTATSALGISCQYWLDRKWKMRRQKCIVSYTWFHIYMTIKKFSSFNLSKQQYKALIPIKVKSVDYWNNSVK